MSSTISIQEVLSYIRSDEGASDTFLIKFVRASGKKKGSIKTVAKARYGAVKPKDREMACRSQVRTLLAYMSMPVRCP
jgi:hypothetical protein